MTLVYCSTFYLFYFNARSFRLAVLVKKYKKTTSIKSYALYWREAKKKISDVYSRRFVIVTEVFLHFTDIT